jgi:hypothetical protein
MYKSQKALTLLMIAITLSSCKREHLEVKSFELKSEKDIDGYNHTFMKLTFDDKLKSSENVLIYFNCETRSNKKFKWEDDCYGVDNFEAKMYTPLWKGMKDEELDFFDKDFIPGNIKTLVIEIYNEYKGDLLFKHQYENI